MGCEMDGYAYIDACSDVTGVCRMNRKRVNMCPAYRDIKELDSAYKSTYRRNIHKITYYYKYSYTPSLAQCI